jgi:putative ABC transport system ATP-binding protein
MAAKSLIRENFHFPTEALPFQSLKLWTFLRTPKKLLFRFNHEPSKLSGGDQQRVSIARALANRPAVILADEPTGDVDSKTRDSIVRIFKDLSEKGQTILVVTHDSEVAKECPRVLRITAGMIKHY